MSIKTFIEKEKTPDTINRKYPYVGKSFLSESYVGKNSTPEFLILFVYAGAGFIVVGNGCYEVGEFRTSWCESKFTPVETTIEFGV